MKVTRIMNEITAISFSPAMARLAIFMFAAAAVASARAFSLSSTLGDHMVVFMHWSKDGARVGLDL